MSAHSQCVARIDRLSPPELINAGRPKPGLLMRDRRALNARYLAELRRRTKIKVDELPMVFAEPLAPADITTLGEQLLARSAHRE